MKKRITTVAIAIACLAVTGGSALAHCQVPCGIYDDAVRVTLLKEHVATIEKSMKQIQAATDTNQSVRWVLNKDKHADELAEIVTYYFMAQRIKAGSDNYAKNLELLHGMLVQSMKAKQTTNLEHTANLSELIHQFEHSYMGLKD